ncbi:MAG: hypothetical protein IPP93_07870 [Chitinophagaceae bacterium]|nr:hypothetical protein [Chitinophagaceae bacterium]
MQHFVNISAIQNYLERIYKSQKGKNGQTLLKKELIRQLQFTEEQAQLYSSTVLTKNSNDSADWVYRNATKMLGRWVHIDQYSSAGYMNNKTDTWHFKDDLTYQHKIEKYESSFSTGPFQSFSMTSNPTPTITSGIWAPSDRLEQTINVVIISFSGYASRLKIAWPDEEDTFFNSCKIDDVQYAK